MTIPPRGQISKFLTQLAPSLAETLGTSFRGQFAFTSNVKVAITKFDTTNGKKFLLSSGKVYATGC
jgi:hypothetical protein